MNTILVPTDFSKYADYALDVAIKIAKKTDSKILLINTLDYSDYVSGSYSMSMNSEYLLDTYAHLKQQSDEGLKEREGVLDRENVPYETKNMSGFLHDAIGAELKNKEITLVVMGTKGTSGLKEVFVGSNAEKIVRTSPVPVITISDDEPDFKIESILIVNDFSEEVGLGFKSVLDFANIYGAKLHLVRINSPSDFKSTKEATISMEDFATEWKLKDYTTMQYDHGYFEFGLLEARELILPDLVVMGTHGRKGLGHLFIGSTTESIVNHISTPFLTFKIK